MMDKHMERKWNTKWILGIWGLWGLGFTFMVFFKNGNYLEDPKGMLGSCGSLFGIPVRIQDFR